MICEKCCDYDICKLGNFKNIYSGIEHPIFTDNVADAIRLYSKASGESVVFSERDYLNKPHKVIELYRSLTNLRALKKKRDLEKQKPKGK